MIEPLKLTDLQTVAPGLQRVAHGYATAGSLRRIVYRIFTVLHEVSVALPRDLVRFVRAPAFVPLRLEIGVRPDADATRIALYVHYSASGRVSEMVRFQLETLGHLGFSIVFISMAERIPEHDWQAVRQLSALVVQRRNFGLDFGAWRDLLPEVRRRWSIPEELMLANDSVLGPIHPLAPLIETMRAGGEGLFGLTESLQGGPHLQSYMLLTRGKSAVEDIMHFIGTLRISHSKWLLVQMGEVRLARWMLRRGHRVAALFGYDRLIQAALADRDERKRVAKLYSKLRALDRLPDDQASALLHRWPLNPTHHLWHVLAMRFKGPFLKTQLVARNPGQLPDVAEWAQIVPPDSPCPVTVIQAHLETIKAR